MVPSKKIQVIADDEEDFTDGEYKIDVLDENFVLYKNINENKFALMKLPKKKTLFFYMAM